MVLGKGFLQLRHGLRPVGLHARFNGFVVRRERRPAQTDCVAVSVDKALVLRLHITDDRTMAGAAHLEGDIRLAFDADGFAALRKSGPTIGRAVLTGSGRVELLQIQVLHIGPGVGEAPGHARGAAQHHKGQAGQGGTDHVERGVFVPAGQLACRSFEVGVIPDGRRTQSQMRVVGQQGLARHGATSGHHPVVAALALQNAHVAHPVG